MINQEHGNMISYCKLQIDEIYKCTKNVLDLYKTLADSENLKLLLLGGDRTKNALEEMIKMIESAKRMQIHQISNNFWIIIRIILTLSVRWHSNRNKRK